MDSLFADVESGRFFRSWVREGTRLKSRRSLAPSVSRTFTRGERDVLRQLTDQSATKK